MSHRLAQLNSLIQREVAIALPRVMNERKFGLLTVTNVEAVRDLDSAKVFVSCLKNGHQFEEEASHHIRELQTIINSRLVLRKVPKLILKLDPTAGFTEQLDTLVPERAEETVTDEGEVSEEK